MYKESCGVNGFAAVFLNDRNKTNKERSKNRRKTKFPAYDEAKA